MARASAFQAEGCEFESRFPLHLPSLPFDSLSSVRRLPFGQKKYIRAAYKAHVAQSVERVLGKDEVSSSILLVGSIPFPEWMVEPKRGHRSAFVLWTLYALMAGDPVA